eukprot:CAMPEP_0114496040 /NCGR_PEP_ID=MMETSP0109-20121206/5553_1 /TAXON_ID=29199 /ORGANISM="Chlorarachnion reptans, Strain CCCM449" /LENGTH=458 /DNA_ID=CAMNT_0001673277 /DNA_START=491 /DNA_END=1867 /DNA_ORIENTATION=+
MGASISLNGSLTLFYLSIFAAPLDWIFRRPALNGYVLFMWLQHLSFVISAALRYNNFDFGFCVYCVGIVLAVLAPLMIYRTLLLDSLYWQGKWFNDGYFRKDTTTTNILSPLTDTSLIPESAIRLAHAMDEIDRVPLLNHALLRIKTQLSEDPGLTRRGIKVAATRNSVVLGHGSNARVYSGFYKENPCAIKMMFTPELTPEIIDTVCAEAGMLGSLRHSNIVDIFGVCVYPPSVCMVMELCQKGSVSQLIHKENHEISRQLLMKICLETANAVSFLHEHEPTIIHLDIKPSNLLLDRNFTVKLADLELARRICCPGPEIKSQDEGSKQKKWVIPDTINWTAPELLKRKHVYPTTAADVYSLAMVIYEIYARKVPYTDFAERCANDCKLSNTNLEDAIISGLFRPQIPETMPEDLAEVVSQGWSSDPRNRPSAKDFYIKCLSIRNKEGKEYRFSHSSC